MRRGEEEAREGEETDKEDVREGAKERNQWRRRRVK